MENKSNHHLRSGEPKYNAIAESNNFIILDKYTKYSEVYGVSGAYQSEEALEDEFINDLKN